MESYEYFSFRSRRIQVWLAGVVGAVVVIAALFPPAFWLCGVGVPLVVVATLAHSGRTGQWYAWQRWESSLNWFEGWAGVTGATMVIVPRLSVVVRAWLLS